MKFGIKNSAFDLESSRTAILNQEDGNNKEESCTKSRLSILSVADARDACIDGLLGQFHHLENDFTSLNQKACIEKRKYFRNEPNWDRQKCEMVKRFRFVICSLGLAGLAFGLMSRMILNVAIVEMTRSKACTLIEAENSNASATSDTTEPTYIDQSTFTPDDSDSLSDIDEPNAQCDGLHFDWSVGQQNFLLASFYIGYAPSMFFSGGIADKYGSKLPLLVCIVGSSIFNMLTPMIAATSFSLLITSRIVLGLLQGSMIPAIYSLFNSWLTLTETSIFVPLGKVSSAFGFLVGSMLPGLVIGLGYEWPFLFYIGGIICATWSLIWFWFATSKPHDNRFVRSNELERIMRKKTPIVSVVKMNPASSAYSKVSEKFEDSSVKSAKDNSIPWLLIITSPSVLALTFVKFTYNLGFDFLLLQQATYLKKVHSADMSQISAVPSASYLMQMFCVTFVGWAAKELVGNRALGFSVSAWRKIFQSLANFGMAIGYFMLPIAGSNIWIVTILIMVVNFHWMMGAGGESMVPYDLSAKYPATIMGLAHSISVLSGVTVPAFTSLVLGDQSEAPERWNTLFFLVGGALVIGNLLFIFILRAKFFLPGEKKDRIKK